MLAQIQARIKAVVAVLGVVLMYLQVYEVANPSHWVTVLIAALTVLGVHQLPNTPETPVAPEPVVVAPAPTPEPTAEPVTEPTPEVPVEQV